MSKQTLRKDMIKRLKLLTDTQRHRIEEDIYHHLYNFSYYTSARMIGITIPVDFEWDTIPIIKKAWNMEKDICVPRTIPESKQLIFQKLNSLSELKPSHYGILEPSPKEENIIHKKEIDLLVVPGLIFNSNGYRVGFGGGYYDRFLTDFTGPTISLLSHKQLNENIPVNQYDRSVQTLITEQGIIY